MIEFIITNNFHKRLHAAHSFFIENKDTPLSKKMLELHKISPTSLYALFSKINCIDLDTLEGLENFNFIILSFYEGCNIETIWEVPALIRQIDNPKLKRLCGGAYLKKPFFVFGDYYGRDLHENESQVIDIIDESIAIDMQILELNKRLIIA